VGVLETFILKSQFGGLVTLDKTLEELCICAIEQGYAISFLGKRYIPLDVYIRLREIKDAI